MSLIPAMSRPNTAVDACSDLVVQVQVECHATNTATNTQCLASHSWPHLQAKTELEKSKNFSIADQVMLINRQQVTDKHIK